MSESSVNIHVLDSAYTPFPSFKEWVARTRVDTVRWDRYNNALQARAQESSAEVLARARNVAKRAAAIDTGAIEGLYEVDRGFTYTVAVEMATWEAALAAKGEYVRSLFEAQLHAYDFVLDLATNAERITEASIRALHVEICKPQQTYRVVTAVGFQEQPLPQGQYKSLPNHVLTRKGTNYSYAPVDVTPVEMARFVSEFRTEEFQAAHPVLQASYAHYCLAVIHPFADGNGRVARALASVFTYRAMSMPIVILSEQKESYLNSLESADSGNFQGFVEFILARCLDTIGLVDESLRLAFTTGAEDSLAALGQLYLTRGGFTYEQVDQAGVNLMELVRKTLADVFAKHRSEKVVAVSSIVPRSQYSLPAGYRFPLPGGRHLQISVSSPPPAQAQVLRNYALALPRDAAGDDDIQLLKSLTSSAVPEADAFIVRVDELTPMVSGVLTIRINMFAERVVNELLTELNKNAAMKMGKTV
jgi:Fic family protein